MDEIDARIVITDGEDAADNDAYISSDSENCPRGIWNMEYGICNMQYGMSNVEL
jgi:hypothetical protein